MQKKFKWILIPASVVMFLFLFAFAFCLIKTAGDEVSVQYYNSAILMKEETVRNPFLKYAITECVAELETCAERTTDETMMNIVLLGGSRNIKVKFAGTEEVHVYEEIDPVGVVRHRTLTDAGTEVKKEVLSGIPEDAMDLFQNCLNYYEPK